MPALFPLQNTITLHSATSYPTSNEHAVAMGLSGTKNKEVRALTIAAFRVAQNNSQLSTALMSYDLLLFLLAGSKTALNYWINKGQLSEEPRGYRLTPAGLTECQDTLLGRAGAYSTTESKVLEWQYRMINGDVIASRTNRFSRSNWSGT